MGGVAKLLSFVILQVSTVLVSTSPFEATPPPFAPSPVTPPIGTPVNPNFVLIDPRVYKDWQQLRELQQRLYDTPMQLARDTPSVLVFYGSLVKSLSTCVHRKSELPLAGALSRFAALASNASESLDDLNERLYEYEVATLPAVDSFNPALVDPADHHRCLVFVSRTLQALVSHAKDLMEMEAGILRHLDASEANLNERILSETGIVPRGSFTPIVQLATMYKGDRGHNISMLAQQERESASQAHSHLINNLLRLLDELDYLREWNWNNKDRPLSKENGAASVCMLDH